MIHDVQSPTDGNSIYECLHCGNIIKAAAHPGSCEECGGGYRNRVFALE